MKASINLALGNTRIKKKTYSIYVYWSFAVVVAIALVIMAVNIGFKIQYASLLAQEQDLTAAINTQAEKKVNMLIVSERTKNIASLYAKRGELDKRLEDLISIFPQSVTISGLNAKDEEFVLTVETSDLTAMNDVLEQDLPSYLKNLNSGIQIVDINSFQAQEGQYALSLRFQYSGGIMDE